MNYCSHCGAPVALATPRGDDRPRFVCPGCGMIHYQNPKVVVGCIPEWDERILLCRRAIQPRRGTWTLPAGYLENGEAVEEGARRELLEEAGAVGLDMIPYGIYNIRHVNQVYLMFITRLATEKFSAGEESIEVGLFSEKEIPWDRISFPVIEKTLQRYYRDFPKGVFPFHIDDVLRRLKDGP